MRGRVVVAGSFNQDFVWRVPRFNAPGQTQLGSFASGPGGKGSNQAIACARLGVTTTFIGALGEDAIAQQAIALMQAEGVDARWEGHPTLASGSAAIWIDAAGQNMIVVDPGANLALSAAHVEAQREAIAAARVVLTQHEIHPDATRRTLELAGEAGALRIHNPAPDVPADAAAPLALVDVLTPNESEFAALLRAHCGLDIDPDALHALADAELHALCRRLPPPSLVLTLGARGAFVSHADAGQDGGPCHRVPARAVDATDTTGAGDAFNGGLAVALAEGRAFADAVRFATAVAALQVQRPGAALAMPLRDEVERLQAEGQEAGTGNGKLKPGASGKTVLDRPL
ncbi:ribokinase [Coralloluteibacterium stylophorae]|uniref:Ribokinase n=2 Tax=Coralloluteibacterium stylophorae TaxID=1776034 RepID=A0AAP2FYY4_9GAMM|nr:ribokinase [Coralloluteibacterium stylophorae]MBS7456046.1 ribokinase [Coralloluteibacterium stylophorae]